MLISKSEIEVVQRFILLFMKGKFSLANYEDLLKYSYTVLVVSITYRFKMVKFDYRPNNQQPSAALSIALEEFPCQEHPLRPCASGCSRDTRRLSLARRHCERTESSSC